MFVSICCHGFHGGFRSHTLDLPPFMLKSNVNTKRAPTGALFGYSMAEANEGGCMRSSIRFVMHPDDEAVLMSELMRDPAVLLINGPRWKSAAPPATRHISAIGHYCIIWSPNDLQTLPAEFIPSCNDWYCRGEYATIQFLRSAITGTVITEGRFAIATDEASQKTAVAAVERRYNLLRRLVKKTYVNAVVHWRNPQVPEAPAGPDRSANPSSLDRSLWVGPSAMTWLTADPARRIRIAPNILVEGAVTQSSV
jgi:hypothetical protein